MTETLKGSPIIMYSWALGLLAASPLKQKCT